MHHPVAVRTEWHEVLKRLADRLLQIVILVHEERPNVMHLDVARSTLAVRRLEVELADSTDQSALVYEGLNGSLTQPSRPGSPQDLSGRYPALEHYRVFVEGEEPDRLLAWCLPVCCRRQRCLLVGVPVAAPKQRVK